jgi:hypothetical protein
VTRLDPSNIRNSGATSGQFEAVSLLPVWGGTSGGTTCGASVWERAADRLEAAVIGEGALDASMPPCEGWWVCTEHGGDDCEEPATERVTLRWVCPDCCEPHAALHLLCGDCADEVTAEHPDTVRRPL